VLVGHIDDMHVVVSLEVDLAEVVFVQEVVTDGQALVVIGEGDVMRTGTEASRPWFPALSGW
jgi:hypothetical protein